MNSLVSGRREARSEDVAATAAWLASRALVLVTAALAGWATLADGDAVADYLALWNRWETPNYESIATQGYAPPGDFANNPAYFPGLALAIKVGFAFNLPAPATGMLVAAISGWVACLALVRLTKDVGGIGLYGVLAWVLSPVAVFLAAPWAEAPFCAFAFWAWWKGRQGSWVAAGVLAGFAALWRVNGLFLGLALLVMFVTSPRRDVRRLYALLLPFAVTAGFFAYLWSVTGDPRAWFTAQAEGWNRHFTDPVTALLNTVDLINTFEGGVGAPHSRFVIEIIAVAGLLCLGLILLAMRWWAESALVLLTTVSLATSTYYYSVPRSAVVLVPIWMLLGLWMTKAIWFRFAYLLVCIPALTLVTIRFADSQWIS